MVQLTLQEIEQYRHSPAHYAVACRNYAALNRILAKLPRLPKAGEVVTEEQSVAAEAKADQVSSVIDRRDVSGRETPLHLAVRLGDAVAVEMLMAAGADWSLQNEQGWSALQEAVCAREDGIAMIITRYYQPMAWAKWCRRLPRITGAMRRMRDLYMEITFQFESSVIPFISRIAPSDTYRIWKRGSNLRADMTLAGFDGFKIQRSDQSFLFLGDGSEDGKVPPGSLLVLTHKDKEVTNALEGAGAQPSEAEIAHEVAVMSQTNMYRPGIDVTQAELVPQLTWRRQEKTEMVGAWKARIYDMHHVLISVKSRRVPGAMTDEQLLTSGNDIQGEYEDEYANILTEEEQQQLEKVLSMGDADADADDDNNKENGSNAGDDSGHSGESNGLSTPSKYDQNGSAELGGSARQQKKNWLQWGRRSGKHETDKKGSSYLRLLRTKDAESSEARFSTDESNGAGPIAESSRLSVADKFASEDGIAFGRTDKRRGSDATSRTLSDRLKYAAKQTTIGKKENESQADAVTAASKKEKTKDVKENGTKEKQQPSSSGNHLENEYKKGLRPVLWLTPDFPIRTDELLPLLDILANKVKAVRRLRELLTTKLPNGMFPVKVAIPIIPTIRVVVTFNKFEELASTEEFGTPLSSPTDFVDAKSKEHESSQSSSSWFSWIRSSQDDNEGSSSKLEDHLNDIDPFMIPPDYTWIDMKEKKRRLKAKKAKTKKGKKPTSSKSPDKANDTEHEE